MTLTLIKIGLVISLMWTFECLLRKIFKKQGVYDKDFYTIGVMSRLGSIAVMILTNTQETTDVQTLGLLMFNTLLQSMLQIYIPSIKKHGKDMKSKFKEQGQNVDFEFLDTTKEK